MTVVHAGGPLSTRYFSQWAAGLVPRHPFKRRRRLSEETVRLIEHVRCDLHFGAMRTRIWLNRMHPIYVAAATIRRICRDLGSPPVRRTEPRRSRHLILFSKEHSDECVQVDVKEVKVASQKRFQYTPSTTARGIACCASIRGRVSRHQSRLLGHGATGSVVPHSESSGRQLDRIPAGLCAGGARSWHPPPPYCSAAA